MSHPFLPPMICYLTDNSSAFRWTSALFCDILFVTKSQGGNMHGKDYD